MIRIHSGPRDGTAMDLLLLLDKTGRNMRNCTKTEPARTCFYVPYVVYYIAYKSAHQRMKPRREP